MFEKDDRPFSRVAESFGIFEAKRMRQLTKQEFKEFAKKHPIRRKAQKKPVTRKFVYEDKSTKAKLMIAVTSLTYELDASNDYIEFEMDGKAELQHAGTAKGRNDIDAEPFTDKVKEFFKSTIIAYMGKPSRSNKVSFEQEFDGDHGLEWADFGFDVDELAAALAEKTNEKEMDWPDAILLKKVQSFKLKHYEDVPGYWVPANR